MPLAKDRYTDWWNKKKESKIDPCYMDNILWKDVKAIQWIKNIL